MKLTLTAVPVIGYVIYQLQCSLPAISQNIILIKLELPSICELTTITIEEKYYIKIQIYLCLLTFQGPKIQL